LKKITTVFEGLLIIEPQIFLDERGFFYESWNAELFSKLLPGVNFVQDNHSLSKHGTIRGMHYQLKKPQGKLVRVTRGNVLDVVIDLRINSKTLGETFQIELSDKNKKMLWIPEGFAHGFQTLSEEAEFQYKTTDYYAPSDQYCIKWNDEYLNINWANQENLYLSKKDSSGIDYFEAPKFEF